jgi:hypothetical protein
MSMASGGGTMRRWGLLGVGLVGLALTLASLTSCGDDTADREEIGRTFVALKEGFRARDERLVCRHLTTAAGRQVKLFRHREPTTCERDVAQFLTTLNGPAAMRLDVDPRVESIEVKGERAVVVARFGPQSTSAYAFAREDGSWRLDSLFGITAPTILLLGTPQREVGFLTPEESAGPSRPAVPAMATAKGKRCPVIRLGEEDVIGGCGSYGEQTRVDMRLRTLAGDALLADECTMSFLVLVDRRGRAAIDRVTFSRAKSGGPCNDLRQCFEEKGRGESARTVYAPWPGHITTVDGNRADIEVRACVDTCLGRLEGRTTIALERNSNGLMARFVGADIGRSGLRLAGAWRMDPSDLRVTEPPAL